MALLGELGVIEKLTGRLEIRAAILPVGIQKQLVKSIIEIIMVRNIAPRAAPGVKLLQTAVNVTNEPSYPRPIGLAYPRGLTQEDRKEISDRPLFEYDASIDICLSEF